LKVSTSSGNFTIPQRGSEIVLNGRESKIIVTDFPIGQEKLIYSTAEVLTVSTHGTLPILFLWLPAGESGEFYLSGVSHASALKSDGCSDIEFETTKDGIIVSYKQLAGSSVLVFDSKIQIVVVDRNAAYNTWMPTFSANPYAAENSTGTSRSLISHPAFTNSF
jgi:hypothetical protein